MGNIRIKVPAVAAYVTSIGEAATAVNGVGDTLINQVKHQADGLSGGLSDPDGGARQAVENAVWELQLMAQRIGDWAHNVGFRLNDCAGGVHGYVEQAQRAVASGTSEVLSIDSGAVPAWRPAP